MAVGARRVGSSVSPFDFKRRDNWPQRKSSHPTLIECMAWGIGCFVVWAGVFALAAHQLGAI